MLAGQTAGCGGSPSSPSEWHKPPGPPPLTVRCAVAPAFSCTANVYGEGDVTAAADWSAADTVRFAWDVPVTPSSAVDFPSPGTPRVHREENVYIRADYVSSKWGIMRGYSPYGYAVRPGAASVPLAYLSGFARTEGTELGGVTVEIIEGEGLGKRAVTRADNSSYMIEFLRVNAPFTVRASKPGYSSDTKVHSGIVEAPYGYPENNTLHFRLIPVQ